jgi:hypothetical protein
MDSALGYAHLDPAQRQVWLDGLLERLPPHLQLIEAQTLAPGFLDVRHGTRFALALRARVTVGLTRQRLDEVSEVLDHDWLASFSPEVHFPPRELEVPAHLVATAPVALDGHEWIHRDERPRVLAELERRGWRLPTEVEWELHWRVLRGPVGLTFGEGELCADDWHLSFEGAPRDASAWGSGAEVVRRGDPDRRSVEGLMPGRRPIRSTSLFKLRPVIDVPELQRAPRV